jgi:hypothetical protein
MHRHPGPEDETGGNRNQEEDDAEIRDDVNESSHQYHSSKRDYITNFKY